MKPFKPFRLGTQTSFAGLVFHAGLHGGGTLLIPAAGREEDPAFTIKTMVIQARWPGASAEEVTRQVTDRIEKKLEELESLDTRRASRCPAKRRFSCICGIAPRPPMSLRPGHGCAT